MHFLDEIIEDLLSEDTNAFIAKNPSEVSSCVSNGIKSRRNSTKNFK